MSFQSLGGILKNTFLVDTWTLHATLWFTWMTAEYKLGTAAKKTTKTKQSAQSMCFLMMFIIWPSDYKDVQMHRVNSPSFV